MPGRVAQGRGSVHGQSNESLPSHPALTPLDTVPSGGGNGNHTSHTLHKNHSTFSFDPDTPETPTWHGSAAADHISPSRSAGVTTPQRPTSEGPSAERPLQPLSLSPNTSPRLGQSGATHSDKASSGSDFAAVSEFNGLQKVGEASSSSQSVSQLPVLTTVSFPGPGNSSRSASGSTTQGLAAHGAGPLTDTNVAATAAYGVGGKGGGANTPIPTTPPSTSSHGRSMTLLERRTIRERSMMSISCLSGLNVETLQASMRDTGVTPMKAKEKATAPMHGWSKTVASAALLGDYEVPRTAAANTYASASLSDVAEGRTNGGAALMNDNSNAPCATPSASAARKLPAATPAFHSGNFSAPPCRGSPSLPQNVEFSSSAVMGSAVSLAAPQHHGNLLGSSAVPAEADPAAVKTLDSIPGAIKVASYNILASRLASTDLYPHCPPSVLSEEYRINLVKEEVRLIDPDIFLVEEISVGVHEESLGPYLKSALGLEGHHAIITDRNGQPRCSARPPSTVGTSAQKGGPSSTRKKFGELSVLALHGTSCNPTCTTNNFSNSTPLTSSSSAFAAPCGVEQNNNKHVCANPTTTSEGKSDASALPPLVRAGSGAHQVQRCGSGALINTPAIGSRGSRSPRPSRAQPSFSSMGTTQTTLGTANVSNTTPMHGDVLRRGSSALELTSIAAAAETVAAAAALQGSRGALRSPRQKSASEAPPALPTTTASTTSTASPVSFLGGRGLSPDHPTGANIGNDVPANSSNENHRRIEMDGVAIYYKANRFRALEVVPVYFNALAAAEDRLTPYEHQKLQVNSHNVALLTVLHDTHAQGVTHLYIIAVVHFIWQRTNAQLWQAHQLLRAMEELKGRYSRLDGDLGAMLNIVAPRRSLGMDSFTTQPPSLAETPLYNEMSGGGRSCLRRDLPWPSTPGKQHSVFLQPTTAASDSTTDGGGGGSMATVAGAHNNAATPAALLAPDRVPWRRESVVSTSTTVGGVVVTCVIGGDFNSDRSGPLMEYLCTGRVPEGAQVMDYWKALPAYSPLQRRQTDAEVEKAEGVAAPTAPVHSPNKGKETAESEEKSAAATVPAQSPPPTLLPALVVAHTSPERPQRPSQRTPQLDISTLPRGESTSVSSLGSPPSPTQPSMQPRLQTQPTPDALGTDKALLAATAADSFLLQPSTLPRQRPSLPFPGRARDGVVVTPVVGNQDDTPKRSTDVSSSAPARVMGVTTASPFSLDETPYQLNCMNNFRFGRGSASLITSPVSGSLAEALQDHSAGETDSAPTVAVPPPVHVVVAAAAPTSRMRGRSQDSQSSLSHSSRRHKSFQSGSQTSTDHPRDGSAGSTSLHSRRRTSPEALRSAESSALMDAVQANKSVSRSHSTSEYESVLSNPFGTAGCSMRLPQHLRSDTPIPESSDAGWTSEDAQQQQQPLLPPPPPKGHSLTPGRARKLTPTLGSPFLGSPAENGGLAVPSQAETRVKPLPAVPPAAISSGNPHGGTFFGSLIHPQLSQMDNCEAPPAPKAGAKRRSVNGAAYTRSGTSTNGTCTHSSSTPPASPQASRRRLNDVVGSSGISLSTVSAENSQPPPSQLQQPQPQSSPETLHLSASVSSSSHQTPWPAVFGETTPSKPAAGLIDDVAHAVRFSDAYAPYCYRHPSRVSAVNPSTNMEGRVLDHVLYEDEYVVCGAVLRLGEKQELPNAHVPSDHYMVGAVLVPIHELHRS